MANARFNSSFLERCSVSFSFYYRCMLINGCFCASSDGCLPGFSGVLFTSSDWVAEVTVLLATVRKIKNRPDFRTRYEDVPVSSASARASEG